MTVRPRLDAGAHESRDLVLGVGCKHDERCFDPPVGRVGRVRNAGIGVEADVVVMGVRGERLARPAPQRVDFGERTREIEDGGARKFEQLADLGVAHRVAGVAALFDIGEPVMQRLDQQVTPLRVVEQVLFQVRVAPDDPDVAEHFVQHACRAPGATLGAEIVEQCPARGAEQADHDLAVREGRVVVRNFAQPRRRIEVCCGAAQSRGRSGSEGRW